MRREEFLKKNFESAEPADLENSRQPAKQSSCDQCEVTFATGKALNVHMDKTHKSETIPPKLLAAEVIPTVKKAAVVKPTAVKPVEQELNLCTKELPKAATCTTFQCAKCMKVFTSKLFYLSHMDLNHPEVPEVDRCKSCRYNKGQIYTKCFIHS
jgi:uncharacterized C2H2 Zn-finger protein